MESDAQYVSQTNCNASQNCVICSKKGTSIYYYHFLDSLDFSIYPINYDIENAFFLYESNILLMINCYIMSVSVS